MCLFQNLFLPSVKLARKERVASPAPTKRSTPDSVSANRGLAAADPERVAKFQRLRGTLDPFELSRVIQTKLEGIFQQSAEAAKNHGDRVLSIPKAKVRRQGEDHSDAPPQNQDHARRKPQKP
jgi:hypothetical protein